MKTIRAKQRNKPQQHSVLDAKDWIIIISFIALIVWVGYAIITWPETL